MRFQENLLFDFYSLTQQHASTFVGIHSPFLWTLIACSCIKSTRFVSRCGFQHFEQHSFNSIHLHFMAWRQKSRRRIPVVCDYMLYVTFWFLPPLILYFSVLQYAVKSSLLKGVMDVGLNIIYFELHLNIHFLGGVFMFGN